MQTHQADYFGAYRTMKMTRDAEGRWVVRHLRYGRRCHELRVRNIATMYGRREWGWRIVFTQPVTSPC